jgi:hypothetical protein
MKTLHKWAFEPLRVDGCFVEIGCVPANLEYWDYSHPSSFTFRVKLMPSGSMHYPDGKPKLLLRQCHIVSVREIAREAVSSFYAS